MLEKNRDFHFREKEKKMKTNSMKKRIKDIKEK
jgi:hypothetical protein